MASVAPIVPSTDRLTQTPGSERLHVTSRFLDRVLAELAEGHDLQDAFTGSQSIVLAMIDIAKAFGVKVTAEGVETSEQRTFLAKAGCHQL